MVLNVSRVRWYCWSREHGEVLWGHRCRARKCKRHSLFIFLISKIFLCINHWNNSHCVSDPSDCNVSFGMEAWSDEYGFFHKRRMGERNDIITVRIPFSRILHITTHYGYHRWLNLCVCLQMWLYREITRQTGLHAFSTERPSSI